nr:hypothetical protein KK1_007951 [Ipomoea batatas]
MRSMVFSMFASMSSDRSTNTGIIPHCRLRAILVPLSFVKPNIGGFGRLRERRDAICPFLVYTKIASTPMLLAADKTSSAFCPYNPIADSPDNISASAYCRTASETSATCHMKQIVHTTASLWTLCFESKGICARGISTPRSPLAIIIPSEASTISSIFLKDSKLSILAKVLIELGIKAGK